MKKTTLLIIFTSLIFNSCVVSRKEYEKLYYQKHAVENRLHKKNLELESVKRQFQKEVRAINDSTALLVSSLNKELNMLNSEIGFLNKELSQTNFSQKKVISELAQKDSINGVYLGKLKWIRKQNLELEKQLAVANEEKLLVNEMLVECKKSKGEIDRKSVKNSSTVIYNQKEYSVFVTNSISKVKMGLKNVSSSPYGSIGNLVDEIGIDDVIYASNGGMYLQDQSPQGLYIENGKLLSPLDKKQKGYGNFYMQPNGVFMVKGDSVQVIKSSDFNDKEIGKISYATQSGPMLLIDGKINPKFAKNSKHFNIRNGVGVNDKNEVIFIKSEIPVTFYEMAKFLKEKYNCNNALYLDGVISRIYLPQLDKKDRGGNFGVIIYVTK